MNITAVIDSIPDNCLIAQTDIGLDFYIEYCEMPDYVITPSRNDYSVITRAAAVLGAV